jgi:hypothetical protein
MPKHYTSGKIIAVTESANNPDIFVLENFTPLIGREFSFSDPQVAPGFKLKLAKAYDPSKGMSHPKFRKPLTLLFRGPVDTLLLEGFYQIETEGFGPIGVQIVPTLTPDREENGMGYHVAFN